MPAGESTSQYKKNKRILFTHKNKYKKKVLHEYRSCVILFPSYGLRQIRKMVEAFTLSFKEVDLHLSKICNFHSVNG